MAQAKVAKKVAVAAWKPSWKGLFIAASVTLNIGFAVIFYLMAYTSTLDGMFMSEGLTRYCNSVNDEKFTETTDKTQALREYTCAIGSADAYFDKGFNEYLDSKGIAH